MTCAVFSRLHFATRYSLLPPLLLPRHHSISVKDKLWGKSNGGRVWDFKDDCRVTWKLDEEWISADEVDYDPPPETMGAPTISP